MIMSLAGFLAPKQNIVYVKEEIKNKYFSHLGMPCEFRSIKFSKKPRAFAAHAWPSLAGKFHTTRIMFIR